MQERKENNVIQRLESGKRKRSEAMVVNIDSEEGVGKKSNKRAKRND